MKWLKLNYSKSLRSKIILQTALSLALLASTAFIAQVGAVHADPEGQFSSQSEEGPRLPTVTTNICSLPGALIDAGDLTYESHDIQVIGCGGIINGEHIFNSLTIQNGTLVHSETLTLSLTINNDALIAADGAINISAGDILGGLPTLELEAVPAADSQGTPSAAVAGTVGTAAAGPATPVAIIWPDRLMATYTAR